MFRRIIGFFGRRWVWVLLGVLALCLLVWFVGPLVAIAERKPLGSEPARFITIVAILVVWGLNNLRQRGQERRAEGKLATALAADAEQAAPDDGEQAVLAQRLKEALRVLARARLARGRRLYQLPWYVIIGAPGSGKTTALKNSGLRFPLQSQLGDNPVHGAGGTRYCDWWFTDQAVLIDTAGRYTLQEDARDTAARSWLGFLSLLKKSRPRRPLNGVLVAVSMADLLHRTPTELALQSAAIKRRIQELNAHLDMELPVYLMFTKCDLVAGFAEFFAELEKEARDQVWGVTFPYAGAERVGTALAGFGERYQELLQRAQDRVLHRLHSEPDPRRRALIFEFPRQMLGLRDRLQAFLNDVFIPNQFEPPSLLRGVYFISGTQQGGSAAWVTGVLSPALCAPPATPTATARTYFVNRLLQDVIFAEAELAAANRRAARRFRLAYGGALAAVLLVFAGASLAWLGSHRANLGYLADTGRQIEAYRERTGGGLSPAARDWRLLGSGLDALAALPTGRPEAWGDRPLARGLGLYQGHKIGTQANAAYRRALERHFMPALAELWVAQIQRAGSNEEYLYEALRFYLMLYHPERMDRPALELWAQMTWSRQLPGEAAQDLRSALGAHLKAALDANVAPPPIAREEVAAARALLLKTPLEARLYRRLKSEYLRENPAQFSLEQVLGRKAELLFFRRSGKPLGEGVPVLFTYQGFHAGFTPLSRQLAKRMAEEQWIYGEQAEVVAEEGMTELVNRVEALYLAEYQALWRGYLSDLGVRQFSSAAGGREILRLLSAPDAPLVKVLAEVRRHTALSELPEVNPALSAAAGAIAETKFANEKRRLERLAPGNAAAGIRLPGQPVSDAFDAFNGYALAQPGLPLMRLQESLVKLNQYFDNLAYADDVQRAAFDASRDPGQGGGSIREVKLALDAAPPLVRRWFESLPADSQRITAAAARGHVNDVWRGEVLAFFERAIKGRYPVDPTARAEIRVEDFTAFFGPQGVLERYFQAYVQPFVDTNGGDWRWRRPVGMSAQTLQLFQRARRIRNAFFAGEQAQLEFALAPFSLDTTVTRSLLETAGAEVVYQHGPARSTTLRWPSGATGSRLVFNLASKGTPVSTREEGAWSWFRLLDRHATLSPSPSGNGLLVSFEVQGIRAQYELQPQRAEHPFGHNDLRHFSLPEKL